MSIGLSSFRNGMLCLLALVVGGCGPAVLMSAPLPIRMGTEEESRTGEAQAVGSVTAVSNRAGQSGQGRNGKFRLGTGSMSSSKPMFPVSERLRKPTLQMLAVRIQV